MTSVFVNLKQTSINTQTSVAGLRKVIDQLSLENTGRFIAYDGKEIGW